MRRLLRGLLFGLLCVQLWLHLGRRHPIRGIAAAVREELRRVP